MWCPEWQSELDADKAALEANDGTLAARDIVQVCSGRAINGSVPLGSEGPVACVG